MISIFQQKYFDSGDYAMAKAKTGGLPGPGMKAPLPAKGKFLPPGPTTGNKPLINLIARYDDVQ